MTFALLIGMAINFCLCIMGGVLSLIGFIMLLVYSIRKTVKKHKGLFKVSVVVLTVGLSILLISLLMLISGGSNTITPDEIVIENTTYQTGFYGDLYPINMIQTGEVYTYKDRKIYRIQNDMFDFLQYSDGTTSYGEKGIDGGKNLL